MRTARIWIGGLGSALLTAACITNSVGGIGNGGTGNGGTGSGTGGAGPGCATGQTECATGCADLGSDEANCGSCGTVCSVGTSCTSGSCTCTAGLTECAGTCVDTQASAANCGTCGNVCPSPSVCSLGQCQATCGTGLTQCGTDCVDTTTSLAHCGGCNQACASGQVCSSGACQCTGAQEQLCGSACVNTDTSDANCGSCGNACGSNQRCTSGACVDLGTGGTGGTGTGGAGTGGTGGTNTGGTSTGGTNTGGTSTGGTNTGGTSGTGGGATGGTSGTGGGPTETLVTSAPNAYWNTSGTLTTVTTGTPTVTVNDTNVLQSWEGFGGAFNEMGWNYLMMLSQSDRDMAIQLLFGTSGAHFNMGRIPMGASDYALIRYTEDETANDTGMSSFSISRDSQYLIPYIKAAQAANGSIRFWASPWTPPTWMKTNSGSVNGTNCTRVGSTAYDGGCMQNNDTYLGALAQYFVKFVQGYGQQGITIEVVAPQNEPNYAQGYPSALWDSALFAKFVPVLGSALSNAGLSTKIMLGTMSNNGSNKDPTVVSAVMGSTTAKNYIKVIGMQWGMQSGVSGAKQYGLPIWQTEHKAGNYPWMGGYVSSAAPNDQAYGVESWGLIRDWIKAGVTSYSAWNMVLDRVGKGNDTTRDWAQDSLLVVDTSTKKLILTPAFYVFRHCSQYVQPGAKVVGTTGGDALAFKNPDGTIVAVMYNSGGAATYIVQIAGKRLRFSMPGTGWATVVSQ